VLTELKGGFFGSSNIASATSLVGTSRTSGHVRFPVAVGGKADIAN
jgi:hypothetical protein